MNHAVCFPLKLYESKLHIFAVKIICTRAQKGTKFDLKSFKINVTLHLLHFKLPDQILWQT